MMLVMMIIDNYEQTNNIFFKEGYIKYPFQKKDFWGGHYVLKNKTMCKDMDTIDNDSLLEATEDIEIVKNIKGTETSHYRRTKKVIENNNQRSLH